MLEPTFLDGHRGRVLCTFFLPEDSGNPENSGRGLLLLPPFGEEMNKSRAMLAWFGYAAARAGIVAAILDPYGTGDSEGEFAEAEWAGWREDVVAAAAALASRGAERLTVCGLRTGALLSLDACRHLPALPEGLVLWHPVASGRQFLTQFLRLRLAAGMGAGPRDAAESTEALRARLQQGEVIEVAGYALAPDLARSLDALDAETLAPPLQVPAHWLEISGALPPRVSPAGGRVVDAWKQAGCRVEMEAVGGASFWATQEIASAPQLIERSLECLLAVRADA